MDVTHNIPQYKYNRDILLQLRMHPLSLRKPDVIKLDVVKDKLNLHQINNWNSNQTLNMSNCSFTNDGFGSMKLDVDPKPCCSRPYQEYHPWRCSFSSCGKKPTALPNGILPCKNWQYTMPNFISPLRKNCLTLPDYLCDSSIEDELNHFNSSLISWPKPSSPHYGSQPKGSSKACLKNEKKVLPIIDPSNGKNILDGFEKITPKSEDGSCNVDVASNSPKSPNIISEIGDSWDNGENEATNLVKNKECGDSDENMKSNEEEFNLKQSEIQFSSVPSTLNSCNEKENNPCISNLSTADSEEFDKDFFKQVDYESTHGTMENQLKLNLMLKEKLHMLKREQQRMTIYQSFLRFKKHQIEDFMRNLEDKRAEMTNWECSLMIKARELQDKDFRLETKKIALQSKEEKLEEREKSLIKKGILHNELNKVPFDGNFLNQTEITKPEVDKMEEIVSDISRDNTSSEAVIDGSVLECDETNKNFVEKPV